MVSSLDGRFSVANIPSYIVRPARFPKLDILQSSPSVRIIDFGEALLDNGVPSILHTPPSVRAPEIIFGDVFNRRVDLWSASCLINQKKKIWDHAYR